MGGRQKHRSSGLSVGIGAGYRRAIACKDHVLLF